MTVNTGITPALFLTGPYNSIQASAAYERTLDVFTDEASTIPADDLLSWQDFFGAVAQDRDSTPVFDLLISALTDATLRIEASEEQTALLETAAWPDQRGSIDIYGIDAVGKRQVIARGVVGYYKATTETFA